MVFSSMDIEGCIGCVPSSLCPQIPLHPSLPTLCSFVLASSSLLTLFSYPFGGSSERSALSSFPPNQSEDKDVSSLLALSLFSRTLPHFSHSPSLPHFSIVYAILKLMQYDTDLGMGRAVGSGDCASLIGPSSTCADPCGKIVLMRSLGTYLFKDKLTSLVMTPLPEVFLSSSTPATLFVGHVMTLLGFTPESDTQTGLWLEPHCLSVALLNFL